MARHMCIACVPSTLAAAASCSRHGFAPYFHGLQLPNTAPAMRKMLLFAALWCSLAAPAQDTLYKTDLPVAARVAGLNFNPAEIDSMYDGVKQLRVEVMKMHKLPLANAVPPTMQHSPFAGIMPMPAGSGKPIRWDIAKKVELPANRADLAFYNIGQLAALLKHRKITSVELTQFFIDRIRRYGDSLQCVITLTDDLALQQAKQADAEIGSGKWRGPLHGIPYGLKDLFAVKGTKTTWGAAPYKNQVIDEDAAVYEKLSAAGAVLVAKFTLGALAMGDRWYGGQTKNPWNLARGSSGSSAGSASATVAGLVPFAIGTETLGSIISPSTACGATGLRPTFGRVSRHGAMTLCWSLDKAGPICRSAEDCAMVLDALHGADPRDAASYDAPFDYNPRADVKGLRIGYAKNYFDRLDTSRNEWKVLDVLRGAGATLKPVVFPDSGVYQANLVRIVLGAESAAAFDEFTRGELDDLMTWQGRNDWPNSFRSWRFISAVDYINANRHRYLLMQEVNKLMAAFDVIICPTGGGSQLAITNLTGHPALAMPTGFDRRFGTPTSITLVGKLLGEAAILTVAKAYQQATEWDDRHPEWLRK